MESFDFQTFVRNKSSNYGDAGLYVASLGLTHSVGAFAKLLLDKAATRTEVSAEEVRQTHEVFGDILWHVTALANEVGANLQHLALEAMMFLPSPKTFTFTGATLKLSAYSGYLAAHAGCVLHGEALADHVEEMRSYLSRIIGLMTALTVEFGTTLNDVCARFAASDSNGSQADSNQAA